MGRVHLADLNADGALDLALSQVGGPHACYQFGDGTGQFAAVDSVGGTRSTSMLAFGDLDGDGDLDIYEQNTNFTPQSASTCGMVADMTACQVFANGTNSGDGRSQFVALGWT